MAETHLLSLALVMLITLTITPLFSESKKTKVRVLMAPVVRDADMLQYITEVQQRTPLSTQKLVIDLNGNNLWMKCNATLYVSRTWRTLPCDTKQCRALDLSLCESCNQSRALGCHNMTCSAVVTGTSFGFSTQMAIDIVALASTDGKNPRPLAKDPNFVFACVGEPPVLEGVSFLEGLAKGVNGMASFSNRRTSVPNGLSKTFSFRGMFALCHPSSSSPGVVFYRPGPYVFLGPNLDVSKRLTYTPLIKNSLFPDTYFLNITGIVVDDKSVPFDKKLLGFDPTGVGGGIKISTLLPYTSFVTPIYKELRDAFVKAAASRGITVVAPVKPFSTCFSAKNILSTRLGRGVPEIGFVLHEAGVVYRMFGANSMVQVNADTFCLAFVDGGEESCFTPIHIGGHQMQDNLLRFDLGNSQLGFSGSVLGSMTTCSNFNFTSFV